MENNENLVTQQVTENVEQPTEQTPKMYTQEEVDEIMGKRTARLEAKIRKEYDREYGDLMEVLKTGTGKQSVGEITESFREHYTEKGVSLPQKSVYSEEDISVLAKADAADIISAGYDDVMEEVERLEKLGADRMTDREKQVYRALLQHRQGVERNRALAEMGVPEDVYNSKDFLDFAAKFDFKTPITDVYDIYHKTQQKEVKSLGSMKNTVQDTGVKDFYTWEEAQKIPREELRNNPALMKAIEESMRKW